MGEVAEWRGWRLGVVRRAAASRHAPMLAGCSLALLAVGEQAVWLAVGAEPAGRFGIRAFAHTSAAAISGSSHAAISGAGSTITQSSGAGLTAQYVLVLFALCLATTVPVAFLRPAAAAAAVSAASFLSLAAFQTLTLAGLAAELAVLHRLGRQGSRLLAPGLALPFLILALAGPAAGGARPLTVVIASLGPAAALAGAARQARAEAAEHGAARQVIAGTLLEHTVRGERARIARELHDVVAHHISMIAVQAETARLATPGMPPAGAKRLLDIGDTARAALTEMRRLLGVLREDARAAAPGVERADRRPQPGLGELNGLVDEVRDASGTGLRLILRGAPAALDPATELAAYRIVQEALTNARRHAPGAAVDVELHYTDETLRVRIRDNGPGPPHSASGGHGLAGMRERAAAVGGDLRTGPAVGGGFLVEAALPVKAEAVA